MIERPLSVYMEWELEYYSRVSIPRRGESVFTAECADVTRSALPAGDLIMFDGQRAILNSYGKNGLLESADFYDQQDDLERFLALRKTVLEHAKPLLA